MTAQVRTHPGLCTKADHIAGPDAELVLVNDTGRSGGQTMSDLVADHTDGVAR